MNLTMVRFIRDNGLKTALDMAVDFKFGKMARNTKAIGQTIWVTEKDDLFIVMEMFMKENGSTIRLMEKEHTFIWMEQNIQGSGLKTNNMAMESRHGQIMHVTKVIMSKERNMVPVLLNGPTPQCLLENSIITTSRERVFICGPMDADMRVSGRIIKCTEKEVSHGQMEEFMWESTLMIKRVDMVNLHGLMEDAIKAIG